jgi:hypothetical protein
METKLNPLKDYAANPGTPFILALMILLLSAAALLDNRQTERSR